MTCLCSSDEVALEHGALCGEEDSHPHWRVSAPTHLSVIPSVLSASSQGRHRSPLCDSSQSGYLANGLSLDEMTRSTDRAHSWPLTPSTDTLTPRGSFVVDLSYSISRVRVLDGPVLSLLSSSSSPLDSLSLPSSASPPLRGLRRSLSALACKLYLTAVEEVEAYGRTAITDAEAHEWRALATTEEHHWATEGIASRFFRRLALVQAECAGRGRIKQAHRHSWEAITVAIQSWASRLSRPARSAPLPLIECFDNPWLPEQGWLSGSRYAVRGLGAVSYHDSPSPLLNQARRPQCGHAGHRMRVLAYNPAADGDREVRREVFRPWCRPCESLGAPWRQYHQ